MCPGFPLHGGWIDRAGIDQYHPPALRDAMLDVPLYVKLAELAVMGGGVVSCAIRQMVQR